MTSHCEIDASALVPGDLGSDIEILCANVGFCAFSSDFIFFVPNFIRLTTMLCNENVMRLMHQHRNQTFLERVLRFYVNISVFYFHFCSLVFHSHYVKLPVLHDKT